MTTYSYNLSLDDSEAIALERALKCYLSPKVQALMAANPDIGLWGNSALIRGIVEQKLTANVELASTSTFNTRRDKS